jgi:hypothetical protein
VRLLPAGMVQAKGVCHMLSLLSYQLHWLDLRICVRSMQRCVLFVDARGVFPMW